MIECDELLALESRGKNVWNIQGIDQHPACLRGAILYRPDAHPAWSYYFVSIAHLRQVDSLPPPHLMFADATHELMILVCDPKVEPNPRQLLHMKIMQPPNLVHQFCGLSDPQAEFVFKTFLSALADGRMSPDSDFRLAQMDALDALRIHALRM